MNNRYGYIIGMARFSSRCMCVIYMTYMYMYNVYIMRIYAYKFNDYTPRRTVVKSGRRRRRRRRRCCCSITVTAAAASQGVPLRCIVLSPMKYGGNFNKRHLSLARGSV